MSEVERPMFAKEKFPAPAEMALNAPLPNQDVKNPFANGGSMSETVFHAQIDSDSVMAFKNSSSDPKDMDLPFGRGYGEFTQADDSRPRARFQDKVDKRSITEGNTATVQDTGKAHG